ncbi:MAG: hypothetical protein IKW58_03415 [Alphaproteobacteria bacterium]|nr:hypothetical protein [Alphaproteobacteria bacterium]
MDNSLVYDDLFLSCKKTHNFYVFLSGAEQVGTSWCVLSIFHALNIDKKRTLIVDGNGNLSNISSYLHLSNPSYLETYFDGKKTLNQLVFAYKNKDFNLLASNSGNKYLDNQAIGRIQIFARDLQIISENYDFSAIDIGTSLSINNLSICQTASDLIVVCSDNSADIVKTFDTIKFINELGLGHKTKLIINKVNSFEDGYKIYEKLSKAAERNGLKFPDLLGIIRLDARIRDAIKNKELLLTRYPQSEAAQDIFDIAKKFNLGA